MSNGTDDAAGIVANWFRDPLLHAFKDDFGRSARRHGFANQAAVMPELPGFAAKLELLGELRSANPDFFKEHDYRWAFDRASYVNPGGGALDGADQNLRHQLTVLRTLIGTWDVVRGMGPRVPLDFSGVCAREVGSSGLSPTCRQSGGHRYLMMPFGFRRLTCELLHRLCSVAEPDTLDGPACFAALSRPVPADALEGFALPFVARRLGLARSDDMANQHAAEDFLLSEVEPFIGRRVDLSVGTADGLAAGLHELLLAFAANHELGHLLYRHEGRRYPSDEGVADTTSLDVSLLDWGWLASAGSRTGLPDPVWMLLGPRLFFWAAEIVLRLDALLDRAPGERGVERSRTLAERRALVEARAAWLVREVWPRFGVAAPEAALDAVAGFGANLDRAAAAFSDAPDLAEAVRVGKMRLGVTPAD